MRIKIRPHFMFCKPPNNVRSNKEKSMKFAICFVDKAGKFVQYCKFDTHAMATVCLDRWKGFGFIPKDSFIEAI